MYKKVAILIIAALAMFKLSTAQEQLSKKQLADRLFDRYEYAQSLKLYLQLTDKRTTRVQVIERIANCYRLMNKYEEAEQWYATALNYDKAGIDDIYYYAEVLLRNQKFEQARKQYDAYFKVVYSPETLKFKLATCDSAEKWIAHPASYTLKNEQRLNTSYADWGLTPYGMNGYIFTSDRPSSSQSTTKLIDPRTGNNFLRLYATVADSTSLLPLDIKSSAVFNGDYHIGSVAFTALGDTAYITVTTTVAKRELPTERDNGQRLYTRRLQLLVATQSNGKWGNFKNFPYNNVQDYSTGHTALSRNGNILYFASDRPGGEGKTDIWYCLKQPDGNWSSPVNCGKAINTKDDEAFPVILSDSLLSFASKGLPGMGGYDLFIAQGSLTAWSKPINLKYPANSTSDDFYLTSTDGLQNGYLSSNRQGGAGSDDIYSFSNPTPVEMLALKPQNPSAIRDALPKAGQPLLTVIYYDLDKSDIRPDAATELDKLIITLKSNPATRVQLASYTDSRASAEYNLNLSQRRSASAFNYLIAHGISAGRLVIKSYGEANLVNRCADDVHCTEAEQQLNRRTEISWVKE